MFYIVDRTARFAELGKRVHAFLERGLGKNFFESGQLAADAVIGDSLRVKLEGELPRLEEVPSQTFLEERVDPSPELREARRAIDNIKDKFRTRRARRRVALI